MNFNKIVKPKITITIIMLLVLIASTAGATFAYFYLEDENSNEITGNLATIDLTLSVTKIFPSSESNNTGVLVPQLSVSESSTSPLASALKRGCVDDNNNIVCQVYEITIENAGGTANETVDGSISFYADAEFTQNVNDTIPNLKWKLVNSVDVNTPTNSILGTDTDKEANSDINKFDTELFLTPNSKYNYYVIVWFNETGNKQDEEKGKSYYGIVNFNSSNGTGVTATFYT